MSVFTNRGTYGAVSSDSDSESDIGVSAEAETYSPPSQSTGSNHVSKELRPYCSWSSLVPTTLERHSRVNYLADYYDAAILLGYNQETFARLPSEAQDLIRELRFIYKNSRGIIPADVRKQVEWVDTLMEHNLDNDYHLTIQSELNSLDSSSLLLQFRNLTVRNIHAPIRPE
ncbi:hypothetical protein F4679DRAFT_588375 [Xylaria curta]|nr:hypothetical protein F4679DRAFT_588375 [Xylaria curta]